VNIYIYIYIYITENLFFKKSRGICLGSYQDRSKKLTYGLGYNHNRGQKARENLNKKKLSPMASVLTDPRQKDVYMAPVSKQPRHKTGSMASGDNRPNMPRFQTRDKMWKITGAESPYCKKW